MIIYPAIDCRQGRCVRLYQGDYQLETVYGHSLREMAAGFMMEKASWLHLVDLDGAKNPLQNQRGIFREFLKTGQISTQVGGGIRSLKQVEDYLNWGAKRVVIGSLALKKPNTFLGWLKQLGGEQMVLAVDVKLDSASRPKIAVNAWQQISDYSLSEFLPMFVAEGLQHVLCTDIARDGTLTGPNESLYRQLTSQFPSLNIQASGGIQSLNDIRRLKAIGVAGVVIGRALYEKKFTLREALLC